MKKQALLILLLAGFILSACGSSTEVNRETLADAMDTVCSNGNVGFRSLGIRAPTLDAIADEFHGTAATRQAILDHLKDIDADPGAEPLLYRYIVASEVIVAQDRAIADAAEAGNPQLMNEILDAQRVTLDGRQAAASELGNKVCGQKPEVRIVPSTEGPAGDVRVIGPEAGNVVLARYLDDGLRPRCDLVDLARPSTGRLSSRQCRKARRELRAGRIRRTETYGPIAQANLVGRDRVGFDTYFVVGLDGRFHYGGHTVFDAGADPEENDCGSTAGAVVDSIRSDRAAAFNRTLTGSDSPLRIGSGPVERFRGGPFTDDFVADVRGGDSDPIELAINGSYGFFYLPGERYDWVMAMQRMAGVGGRYRFTDFYPILTH